jgi:outer membrane protein assembly factor BamD (BamD/ComL family)
MRRFKVFWLLVLSTLFANEALAEKRIALVIGNYAYQNTEALKNPARDADAVARMFKDLGFDDVDHLSNLTNVEFKRTIRKFEDKSAEADVAVVFFAGHGIESGGVNYMIPIDAKLRVNRDAEDEAIALGRIIDANSAKRLRLVILDACRDNPFTTMIRRPPARSASRSVATSRGLAQVDVPNLETLIVFAAKAGTTADDGDGEHSPFTTSLLKYFPEPADLRFIFGRIRDDVLRLTDNRQEPYMYGSVGGSAVFLVPPAQPSAAPTLASVPSTQILKEPNPELVIKDYQIVMNAYARLNEKTPLLAFLKQYPTGFYSDIIRAELEEFQKRERVAAIPLESTPQPPKNLPDLREWDQIKDTDNPDKLRSFIGRFPNSPKAPEAQHRLDMLLRIVGEREEKARAEAEAKRRAEEEAKRQRAEAESDKAWLSVQDTEDQTRLREFIRRYPESPYTSLAKERLAAVVRAAREREEQARLAAEEARRQKAEDEVAKAFEKVQSTTDPAVARDFVRQYPGSRYAPDAMRRLDELNQAVREQQEERVRQIAEAKRQKMETEASAVWNQIRDSNDQAALRGFMKRFPESTLTLNGAAPRLADLEREDRARRERLDAEMDAARRAWNSVRDTSDPAELREFIERYPNSPLSSREAKARLDLLEREAKKREERARVEAEERAAKDRKEIEASRVWDEIKNTNVRAELIEFIGRFPDVSVTIEAKQRLAAITQEREADTKPDNVEPHPYVRPYPRIVPRAAEPPRIAPKTAEPPRIVPKVPAPRQEDVRTTVRHHEDARPTPQRVPVQATRPSPRPAAHYEASAPRASSGSSSGFLGLGR